MSIPSEGLIELYAKQLRRPTVLDWKAVAREANEKHWGYEEFLHTILQREAEQQQDNQRKRRIKAANFPKVKTLDSFDCRWLQ